MSGDVFGDAVNVAARLLDHAGDNETLATASVVEQLGEWERSRFRSLDKMQLRGRVEPVHVHLQEAVRRFGDTAATAYGDMLHPGLRARRHPPGLARPEPHLRRHQPAGRPRPQPAGDLHHRRHPRLALARADRLARRHLPAGRPQLQRHLRPLRQRPRDHQPAPRRLHAARQRRDRPGRAAVGADQPVRPLRGHEVRRHAAADPVRVRHQVLGRDDGSRPSRPTRTGPRPPPPSSSATSARPRRRRRRRCAATCAEFLSDPRVVEIPRLLWWPILHGIVLRMRPARSARKYASIWTPAGSPLKVWTEKQALLLDGYLGQRGHRVVVRYAMRYGTPSIASGARRRQGGRRRPGPGPAALPAVRGIDDGKHRRRARGLDAAHPQPARDPLRQALPRRPGLHRRARRSASTSTGASTAGRDKLVLSFHGLPRRSLDARRSVPLRMPEDRAPPRRAAEGARGFRRRHLPEPLRPGRVAAALHRADAGRAGAAGRRAGSTCFCPGFTSDCLETLEEIDQEARAAFLAAGGKEFGYVACLNDQHEWLAALAGVAIRHLQGWDTAPTAPTPTTGSRRSAGAPSPPARRPDPCLARPGAPIARRDSADCDKRRAARDSRHLRGPGRALRPACQKPQSENDMRQLNKTLVGAALTLAAARGASPRFPPATRRPMPTPSPPPRRKARSSSTAPPTRPRPTS